MEDDDFAIRGWLEYSLEFLFNHDKHINPQTPDTYLPNSWKLSENHYLNGYRLGLRSNHLAILDNTSNILFEFDLDTRVATIPKRIAGSRYNPLPKPEEMFKNVKQSRSKYYRNNYGENHYENEITKEHQKMIEYLIDTFDLSNIGLLQIGSGWYSRYVLAEDTLVKQYTESFEKAKQERLEKGKGQRVRYERLIAKWEKLKPEDTFNTLKTLGFIVDNSRDRGFFFQEVYVQDKNEGVLNDPPNPNPGGHYEGRLQIPKDSIIIDTLQKTVPIDISVEVERTPETEKEKAKTELLDGEGLAVEDPNHVPEWENREVTIHKLIGYLDFRNMKRPYIGRRGFDGQQIVALLGKDASKQLWGHRVPPQAKFWGMDACERYLFQIRKEDKIVKHT